LRCKPLQRDDRALRNDARRGGMVPQRFRFGGGGQNCGRALPDGAADDVDLLEHPPGQRLDRSTVSAERGDLRQGRGGRAVWGGEPCREWPGA
jgi:hypothetical protein